MNTNLQGVCEGLIVTEGLVPDPPPSRTVALALRERPLASIGLARHLHTLPTDAGLARYALPPFTLMTSIESGLALPPGFRR